MIARRDCHCERRSQGLPPGGALSCQQAWHLRPASVRLFCRCWHINDGRIDKDLGLVRSLARQSITTTRLFVPI